MKCPICYHQDTKVIDSRVATDGLSIRRRRECLKCNFRFSTYEEMEILDLTIIKRDGHKEVYSREKVSRGLRRALEKRPLAEESFRKLIGLIERDLQALRKEEVGSDQLGEIVLKRLKEADQVAYIRFASVYQSFANVDDFQKALGDMSEKN